MNDRELLEAAAKAAGISLEWPQDLGGADYLSPRNAEDGQLWRPLKDDGDALRLAVKLRMALDVAEYGLAAFCGQGLERDVKSEQIDGDPYAATRLAIVRAAAAMAAAPGIGDA